MRLATAALFVLLDQLTPELATTSRHRPSIGSGDPARKASTLGRLRWDNHYVTFAYDHRGRLISQSDAIDTGITNVDGTSLMNPVEMTNYYYDSADRMVAWQSSTFIPDGSQPGGNTGTWGPFHDYLHLFVGNDLVAVVSLVEGAGSYSVRALLPDELGATGPSYPYAASWASTPHDVTAYGTGSAALPFLLPGQIVTPTPVTGYNPTSCSGGGSPQLLWARDAVTINGRRDYDPYLGQYLQHDPVDDSQTLKRSTAYSYAWQNPVSHVDPLGLWTDEFGACATAGEREYVGTAIASALNQILSCPYCVADGLKKEWAARLYLMEVWCTKQDDSQFPEGTYCAMAMGALKERYALSVCTDYCDELDRAFALNRRNEVYLYSHMFNAGECGRSTGCANRILAHEALHLTWPTVESDEAIMLTTNLCVKCAGH